MAAKGNLWGFSCDNNIDASTQVPSPLFRTEACGSGTVFATRTSRFNRLKARLFASGGALQLAPLVFFFPLYYRYLHNLRGGRRSRLSWRYRQPYLQRYNLYLLIYHLHEWLISFYLGTRKLRFDTVAHAILCLRLANQVIHWYDGFEFCTRNRADTSVEANTKSFNSSLWPSRYGL